jgi:putative flippase GtrA
VTITSAFARHRRSVRQFVQFGIIGGGGVVVNMLVVALCAQIGTHLGKVHDYDPAFPIPGTSFNIRYYLVYAFVAFVGANVFNFVLNRHWTFRSDNRAPFYKEFLPFLLVGAVAQLVGFGILVALRNPASPVYLSSDFFVDTVPFWRRRLYWAQMIQVVLVMPVNFVVNKLWTFRAVRRRHHGHNTVS